MYGKVFSKILKQNRSSFCCTLLNILYNLQDGVEKTSPFQIVLEALNCTVGICNLHADKWSDLEEIFSGLRLYYVFVYARRIKNTIRFYGCIIKVLGSIEIMENYEILRPNYVLSCNLEYRFY